MVLIVLLMTALVLTSIPMYRSITRYTNTYDEYDINVGMGHSLEYLPVNTPENYYKEIDSTHAKINGIYTSNAILNVIDANTLTVEINSDDYVSVELPRLFYIGYQLKDENGQKVKHYENHNGMIAFDGTTGIYTLKYVGPRIYQLFSAIRWMTLIALAFRQIKIKNDQGEIK